MKKILFVFLVVFASVGEKSYAQTWQWAKSGSGTSAEEGFSTATDTVGNVFITGGFRNSTIIFGADTLTNVGTNNNIFIAKYDANGSVLWAKSSGGTGGSFVDAGYSISTDATGNVFVTGGFCSPTITFGTYTLTNGGTGSGYNVFIAKYDANGNVLWAKSAGSSASGTGDVGYSVSTDGTGNVLITGYFQSPTITFGTYTLTNAGTGTNIFIAKYDVSGNVLWAKHAGGTGYDNGYSVSTDATGNMFITGSFNSSSITFGSYTLTNTGGVNGDNVFIAKYDASGNVLWAKSAGGAGNGNKGYSINADATGNALVTGSFGSTTITFGTYTLTNASGYNNVFITKYDANGNVLWAKSAGGTGGNDVGYSVSTDVAGNAFIAGSFTTTITFGTYTLTAPTSSPDPMFIVKYDGNGNVLCASALVSGGDDQCGVSADRFGNAYIAGDFMANPFIVGSNTLTLTGSENVFVAKWTPDCNKTGIEQFANSNNQITIYPNPTSNQFIIEATTTNKLTLYLYDVNGRLMFSTTLRQAQGAKTTIDVSSLNEGVYTVSIISNEGVVNKKVVILR